MFNSFPEKTDSIGISLRHRAASPHATSWSDLQVHSAFAQQLLFVGATLFVLLAWGYQFGTNDQNIHLPFLKKFADSLLYPGDPFLELRLQHYSFFWFLFIPFYRLGILEPAMFITHLAVTYLTFWGLWILAETLFHNRLASVLSVVLFALPHVVFGGWTFFEVSLLNRTAVLPLLFISLALYLRQRYWAALALLGVTYDLHALSANFVLAMFLFDSALRVREIGFRKILQAFSTFFILALPVLVWKMAHTSADLQINREWVRISSYGLYGTMYLFGSFPFLAVFTASGIGAFVMLAVGLHYAPPTKHTRTIVHFGTAILLIVIAHCAAIQWLPLSLVIQSQLLRAGVFAMLFGMLYWAYYVAAALQSHTQRIRSPAALLTALVLPFPFVPVLAWGLDRWAGSRLVRWLAIGTLCLGAWLLAIQITTANPFWRWDLHVYGKPSAWQETQMWARDHTPGDTVFLTPPELGSIGESDWRVFSERSTVVSIAELTELGLAPDYLAAFRERFSTVAPGALEQMNGDPFHNRVVTRDAFYSLSDDAVLRAACRFEANYLVIEKPHTRAFEQVYENDKFVVYALPVETCDKHVLISKHLTKE